jgi:hypothetical protein
MKHVYDSLLKDYEAEMEYDENFDGFLYITMSKDEIWGLLHGHPNYVPIQSLDGQEALRQYAEVIDMIETRFYGYRVQARPLSAREIAERDLKAIKI